MSIVPGLQHVKARKIAIAFDSAVEFCETKNFKTIFFRPATFANSQAASRSLALAPSDEGQQTGTDPASAAYPDAAANPPHFIDFAPPTKEGNIAWQPNAVLIRRRMGSRQRSHRSIGRRPPLRTAARLVPHRRPLPRRLAALVTSPAPGVCRRPGQRFESPPSESSATRMT